MFEGKRLTAARPDLRDADEAGAAALRQIGWSDIVARLEAARDLRQFIGSSDEGEKASFDATSARWIAEHLPGTFGEPGVDNDIPVNPVASANCKWAVGKSVPAQRMPDVPRN